MTIEFADYPCFQYIITYFNNPHEYLNHWLYQISMTQHEIQHDFISSRISEGLTVFY